VQERGHGAFEHDPAPASARLRTDLDHMIGRADHGLVMLDDHHGVAGIGERADDGDQAVDVARVQADARLVEHEERVHERGAEAGGEVHALDLAAGQGAGGTVEREVAQADLSQVAEARDDRIVGEVALVRGAVPVASRPASARESG
jgi:hypothetical protein